MTLFNKNFKKNNYWIEWNLDSILTFELSLAAGESLGLN